MGEKVGLSGGGAVEDLAVEDLVVEEGAGVHGAVSCLEGCAG